LKGPSIFIVPPPSVSLIRDLLGPIRCSASAAKEPAPVNTACIAPIPVRKSGLEVGGYGEREPRGSFVEGADLLCLTNQVEIGGLVVHDTARLETRKRCEVNEMESVVWTEANIADQERRMGRQQLMTGLPEAGARHEIHGLTDPSAKSVESAIVRINQQGAMDHAMDHGTRRRWLASLQARDQNAMLKPRGVHGKVADVL